MITLFSNAILHKSTFKIGIITGILQYSKIKLKKKQENAIKHFVY